MKMFMNLMVLICLAIFLANNDGHYLILSTIWFVGTVLYKDNNKQL